MARDVVERLRALRPSEASLMANTVVVGLQDLDAVLAVVEAAKEYRAANWAGPPISKDRATRIYQAATALDDSLARLYAGSSGDA